MPEDSTSLGVITGMFDELSQGLVGKPVKSNQAIVNFLMNSRKGMTEAFTG